MDDEKESLELLSESDRFIPRPLSDPRQRLLPWIASTGVLAFISLSLIAYTWVLKPTQFPEWKQSDFRECSYLIYSPADFDSSEQAAARESIEYHQVRFHGNAEYDENGQFFIPNPSPIDYIGPPSPAVDDAWRNLTGGECLPIIFTT